MNIESLRQSIHLINFITENQDKDKQYIIDTFFNKALKVLYMFDNRNNPQHYRKREILVSNPQIYYFPLLNRFFPEFEFSLYNKIDMVLHRWPYFIKSNPDESSFFQKLTQNNKILPLDRYDCNDFCFYRNDLSRVLNIFVKEIKTTFKEKFSAEVEVPQDQFFNFGNETQTIKDDELYLETIQKKFLNENTVKYPMVIKPNNAQDHVLYLIINEEAVFNFFSKENVQKLRKERIWMAQHFIPHGGLMYKCYVLNDVCGIFIRNSLPNLDEYHLENVPHFTSNYFKFYNDFLYEKHDDTFWEKITFDKSLENYPREKLEFLNVEFGRVAGISLFGIDILWNKENETFYLLEFNYFPAFKEFAERRESLMNEHVLRYYHDNSKNYQQFINLNQ